MAGAAVLAGAIAAPNLHWYAGLLRPAFSPPPLLAAAASSCLVPPTAWAFHRVLRRPDYLPDRPAAIRVFLLALVLDVLWSWLFFAGRHPTLALAASAGLAMAAIAAAWLFSLVDRRAALLLLPWASATVFVVLLDLSVTLRNG